MRKIKLCLGLGISAGVVDLIPMLLQNLDWYSNISAFVQWIVLGFLINYIRLPFRGWLNGFIVAVAVAIPVMILVAKNGAAAVIPIIIMSSILGSVVGWLGEKYSHAY